MRRPFPMFLSAVTLYVPALLLLDASGLVVQLALGTSTALLLWYFARRSSVDPRQIACAILIASTGEILLSAGWGLYSYRHALIPLYVPFGHGVLYLLATETAGQPALRRHSTAINRAVLALGTLLAAASLFRAHDLWGLLWWVGAAALLLRSRSALLLSSCCLYAVLLEWAGTALGNWRWAAIVPLTTIPSANPPSGVGILYLLLDLTTVALCTQLFVRPDRALAGQETG